MKKHALSINYTSKKSTAKFHLPIEIFKRPTSHDEYQQLEQVLNKLIDEVRDREDHPLAIVMQIIGENLEQYDNEHYPDIGHDIEEITMVKYLMKTHHLKQTDLADIFGGQANVSKYLNGERPLSKKQIIGLKNTFSISADFFIR